MPTPSEEKKKLLIDIVGEVIDKVAPDSSKHLVFTSLDSRNSRSILLVEVKLASKETTLKFRKGFSAKKRSEGKFLVTKFEFGGSFGMRLEEDCHEVEVMPNLEL
jgi:hypothetical protein